MKNKFFLALLFAFILILMVGCNSKGAQDKGQSEDKKGDATITIGAMLPLTGETATEGKRHQQGYDIWAKKVNENGGIKIGDKNYKVDIKYYDYQSDSSTAVKLTEKMINQDGIKFILGPFGSGIGKAVSSVTEKYQAVLVIPTGGSVTAFTKGYKYIFGTLSDNIEIIKPLFDVVMNSKNPPKTAVIAARNDLYTIAASDNFAKVAKERGVEVLSYDKFPVDAKDFSTIITKYKGLKPDWIFIGGYIEGLITATKQMKQLDANAPVVTMTAGPAYWDYIANLGADADYVTTPCWWHQKAGWVGDDYFKTSENYEKLFKDAYGTVPDYLNASATACGIVFQNAFEKAQSLDPVKVRDAMASLNITTFFGPIKFGELGQNIALPGIVLQIKNKDWVVLTPKDIKTGDLVYPMPKWSDR